MLTALILLTSCIALTGNCETPQTSVVVEPLNTVSFSTVTVDNSWETMPSVALRGRKMLRIMNTSSSDNVYVSNVTDSSTMVTLYPRQAFTFKASSDMNIYVSSNTAIVMEVIEMR